MGGRKRRRDDNRVFFATSVSLEKAVSFMRKKFYNLFHWCDSPRSTVQQIFKYLQIILSVVTIQNKWKLSKQNWVRFHGKLIYYQKNSQFYEKNK